MTTHDYTLMFLQSTVTSIQSAKLLILGGTAESIDLAVRLSCKGFHILHSRATKLPQKEPALPRIAYRHGRLDSPGLGSLIQQEKISVIVDCTHPYAEQISWNAHWAAQRLGLLYIVYDRPGLGADTADILRAENHMQGAEMASGAGVPFLLSIGSSNIPVYVDRARQRKHCVFVRVLPGDEVLKRCLKAGLKRHQIIQARGPFSLEENMKHLRSVQAGLIVTKDSGEQGGVPAKIEACRRMNVQVLVVQRPLRPGTLKFGSIEEVTEYVTGCFGSSMQGGGLPPP